VHPFAGAAYSTSKAALASLTREMAADFGRARRPRQRHRAGRDRHRDPVARHREDRRRADPAAPARHARRGGQDHLRAVHGDKSYVNGAEIHINGGQHVFRNNLASYMDQVCDDRAPLVVTRQNARSVIMMSEEDYEGLMETVHLLKSPANAARLLRSIKQADQGQSTERDIIEPAKAGSNAT
jgi:antitoxin YefM